MSRLDDQLFRQPGLRARGLPTIACGARTFFVRDVQPVVLQACRAHGISFELLARRLNLSRPALALMLRGQDPVPRSLLRLLDDFVAMAQAEAALAGRPRRQGRALPAPLYGVH